MSNAESNCLTFLRLSNYVAVIKKRPKGIRSSPLKRFMFSMGPIPITDVIKAITINREREMIIGFKAINGSDFRNLNTTQQRNAVQKAISFGVVV